MHLINSPAEFFQVIIEGVVGKSYTGDIGIDDIYFTKGSCRGEKLAFADNSTNSGGKVL